MASDALLSVQDLRTYFDTRDGTVKAVDGVSFEIRPGETLGLVGESGCGKSVTAMSIMRLVPHPPARTVSGEIWFDGRDLLKVSNEQMRRIRGREIAMIFQDPMTSLNPVLTIGRQITESLQLHLKMGPRQSRNRAVELLQLVGIPAAVKRIDDYPHQFSGGMRQRVMIAMALSCNPKLLIADRANHGARCDHSGANPGTDRHAAAGVQRCRAADHARYGCGGGRLGSHRGDVCRQGGGDGDHG